MYVNYKKTNIAAVTTKSGASFTFIPGINEIDSKLWSQLLENKHFKSDVDAKHYIVEMEDDEDEIIDDKEPGAPQAPKPQGIQRVAEDKTAQLISETYDIKTLKDMRRNETRRVVLDKIDAQIARLQEERRSNRGRQADEDV